MKSRNVTFIQLACSRVYISEKVIQISRSTWTENELNGERIHPINLPYPDKCTRTLLPFKDVKKKLIKHNTLKKVKANTTFIKGVDNSPTPLLAFIVEI